MRPVILGCALALILAAPSAHAQPKPVALPLPAQPKPGVKPVLSLGPANAFPKLLP
jgi:hypothetical protein